MKKKLALVISICVMMLMLVACGTDPTTVDYNGYSYDQLKSYSEGMVSQLNSYDNDQLDQLVANGGMDDSILAMIESWKTAMTEVEGYQGLGNFTITKSGKTLTTDLRVKYTNRDLIFEVVFNYYDMSIEGYTVEPVYTLGEKMAKAGMNTLISISIVFAVLIMISLIISCFKIFPYLENKKKEKENNTKAAENQVVTQIEQREEQQQLTDDTELVAVIAAAIAASTGTSTSDFVVRSINRR